MNHPIRNETKRLRSYFPLSALNYDASPIDKSFQGIKKKHLSKEVNINIWKTTFRDFCEF